MGVAIDDSSTPGHLRVVRILFRRCSGRFGRRSTVGKTLGWRKNSVSRRFDAFCGHGAHNRPELVWDRDELGAWGLSVLGVFSRLAQRLPAVGQQLLDPTRRVCADPVEHVAKVRLRVDPQVLARRAQAHQDSRCLAPFVASHEQPVFTIMPSLALAEWLIRDSRRLCQANPSGGRIRVGRGLTRATCMHGPPGLPGHGRWSTSRISSTTGSVTKRFASCAGPWA